MKKPAALILIVIAFGILFLAGLFAVFFLLAPVRSESFSTISSETEINMNLTSSAFTQGQPIPTKYSCKGADVSPALAWDQAPTGTQSLALIMDDPDAPMGTWDHWVLFNIPAATRSLAENFQPAAPIITGRNSSGQNGYGGPCPPSGTHRYFFRLYALDTTLNLSSAANKKQVLAAIAGHTLASGELMGTFSK
jgi:hypothetical protein